MRPHEARQPQDYRFGGAGNPPLGGGTVVGVQGGVCGPRAVGHEAHGGEGADTGDFHPTHHPVEVDGGSRRLLVGYDAGQVVEAVGAAAGWAQATVSAVQVQHAGLVVRSGAPHGASIVRGRVIHCADNR